MPIRSSCWIRPAANFFPRLAAGRAWSKLLDRNRLAGLQQRFEIREDLGPTSRDRDNELRVGAHTAVSNGQLDDVAVGFQFEHTLRGTFGLELRSELIVPAQ